MGMMETLSPGSGYMPHWDGEFDVCRFDLFGFDLGSGQYVDIASIMNGYIEQDIILPTAGIYYLTFRRKVPTNIYSDYKMNIWWNNIIVATITPVNMSIVSDDNFSLVGTAGINNLKFEEIGSGTQEHYGTLIDGIRIEAGVI